LPTIRSACRFDGLQDCIMASEKCVQCLDLVTQGHREGTEGTKGGQLPVNIPFSNLQMVCRCCSLLRRMVFEFTPEIEHSYERPSHYLDLEEGYAGSVIVGNRRARDGSLTMVQLYDSTCALNRIMVVFPSQSSFEFLCNFAYLSNNSANICLR